MKKKIWIMNHYANEMFINEGGRHYSFAKNLINFGYEPIIICASSFHNKREKMKFNGPFSIIEKDKINFVFIDTSIATGNGTARIKNMLDFYLKTKKYSKEISEKIGKPDIILASSVHPLTLVSGIKIANSFNIPCICEIRDLWPEAIFSFSNKLSENSFFGKVLVKGEYWIYKNADALIFTKEGDTDYLKDRRWMKSQGGDIKDEKCFYINNGVEIDSFNKNISDNFYLNDHLDSDEFVVVYTGAIRPVNNVRKLVEAASCLVDEKIKILVFGDGNEKQALEAEIVSKNLKNIIFMGQVEKKYVPSILKKSNLNILNYSQTNYNWSRGNSSNKLFEYLASGTPVLSTVKMGYSILDKYNCGTEIFDAKPEQIAREILFFKNMSKKDYEKMSKNALNAAEEFDYKILTNKLITVINYTNERANTEND